MAIYKDEGTWTVQCRIKNKDGSVKQHKKRGFKTKREAIEYQQKVLSNEPKFRMTVKEFYPIYLKDKKGEVKERTVMTKQHMIKTHVLPYFGEMQIDEIETKDIQEWQNQMVEKDYEPTYLRNIANQLVAMLNHACNIYDMPTNPYNKIKKMGKTDANRIDFWTFDEYCEFIKDVKDDVRYFPLFETLYYTGMREGELLALTPKDIDIKANVIHINKTYYRRNKKDFITTPKTEQSIRDIVIPKFLSEELEEYMSHVYGLGDNYRIFPITAEAIQHKMKTAIRHTGVPKIRVHSIRHSHASYLINQGVQPILIKERLGHKDIRMTLNTYGHLYPSEQQKVADLLDTKRNNDKEKES